MMDVGDIGSSSIVVAFVDDGVNDAGRWKRSSRFGHIALSILVALDTFVPSRSKCPNVARRTRISYAPRRVLSDDDMVGGIAKDDDDDDGDEDEDEDGPSAASSHTARRRSRLSIAHSIDAYDTTLGRYTRHNAGTDTDSSARYLAQSLTYNDGPSSRSYVVVVVVVAIGMEEDEDDEDDDEYDDGDLGKNDNRASMIVPDGTTGLRCQSNLRSNIISHASISFGSN